MVRGNGPPEHPFDELAVLDPIARKTIRSWPVAASGYASRFAERGTVLCAGDDGDDLNQDTKNPPRCMSVDSGEKIGEAAKIDGGAPLAAAENATRVVVSDYSHVFDLRFLEYDTALTRRVIWDFRKNVEAASWKPSTQPSRNGSVKRPFVFAISPDGEYVAEGGNGIVRLYKIEP